MKRSLVKLFLVLSSLLLVFYLVNNSGLLQIQNNSNVIEVLSNKSISPAIEKKLKQQVINQFYSLVDYDLEALDEYAPKDEEMEAYYKIFDENAFQEKYKFFGKNYATQGMTYGEDAFYDRDLIMRIGARASVLRARTVIANSEQVNLDEDKIELDTTYIKYYEKDNDFYDLHIRIYHPKSEGYYEFVNEACWLTNRTCINTLGWKFLGRYNKYTNSYNFSELNIKSI